MNKKILVIHHSRYGSSSQYALAIAEKLTASCVSLNDVKKNAIKEADTIVFGAGVYVSKIRGLKTFYQKIKKYDSKKIIVFASGLHEHSEKTVNDLQKNIQKVFSEQPVELCYFPGNFDASKFGKFHRFMMKFLGSALSKNQQRTEEEQFLLDAINEPKIQVDLNLIETLIKRI